MKTYTKYRIAMAALLLLLAGTPGIFAQPGMQLERFKQEKIEFFNEKLQLSEQEADAFWPVYEDLNNRKFKINQDEKSLLDYVMSNADNLSDNEMNQQIDKYLDLQQKRFELDSQYHDRFVDIIGKRKTLKMYALEREFRMHLLRKFRGHGGGMGRNGGGRGNF